MKMMFCDESQPTCAKPRKKRHSATYGARVDGHAVVLVIHRGILNEDSIRRANVKSVCVLAKGVASRSVHRDVRELQVGDPVDAEGLDWRVEDRQALDERVRQIVGLEELGLGDTTAASLAVPIALSESQHMC